VSAIIGLKVCCVKGVS